MALDTKQYIEQLAQAAGLSEEEKAGILKVAANEKFAKALGDDVLRQQDYSRNMDALKADQKKTTDYYSSLVTWKADQQKVIDDALAAANGNGREQHVIQTVQPDLSQIEKKWEEKLAQRDGQMIGLLEVGMNLASRHAVEFKEPLDTGTLKKIAMEKNLSLAQAYDEMVGPRRTEAGAAQRKAEIEAARAEGAREFASKHKIPVDTQPSEYRVLLDRDPKKQVGADDYVPNSGQLSPQATRQLAEGFREAWEGYKPANTSGA